MVYRTASYIFCNEIAKQFKTEILLCMHLTLFKTKTCLLLNLIYVMWTKRFSHMIDTVRISNDIETNWTSV